MPNLHGKNILVTGATGVIGREASLALAKQGATVILVDASEARLNALYDEIVDLGESEPAMVPMDFNAVEPNDYHGLALNLKAEFDHLNGIVHTAAALNSLTPLAHMPHDQWLETVNVTLNAPFFLTQSLLPLLFSADDRTSVIFFEHMEVAMGDRAYWGGYAVAKAGLHTLMKLFAHEFEAEQRIQFNSIDPVAINSPLRYSATPEGLEETKAIEEVNQLVINLNNPDHTFVTGEIFTL